jgi:deazaflavin-dependent oxidoreductase (nitroreductase family)
MSNNVKPLYGAEHVRRYRETDGEEGQEWNGTQTLILTTVGRKTGQKHDTPLIYATYGDAFAIVASKGGAPKHPAWYLNLNANPQVEVQVGPDRFSAKARTATGHEREELWGRMTHEWPAYDSYQTKTDREIPIVVLDRLDT